MGDVERFQECIEMVPDAMVLVDRDGVIQIVNGAAVELFGHAREHFVGQTLDLLMPLATRDQHRANVRAFIDAPRRRMMGKFRPLSARRRDGVEFPVEIALNHITVGTEELVAAAIRDVTVQRATEQKAVEHEAQLRSVIEMARVGTWALELDSGTVALSESFLTLLGLRPGEPQDAVLARLHPDDVAVWQETKVSAERDGHPVRALLRLRHADGSWRTLETRCSIQRSPGAPPMLVGLSIDVSERLRVEALEREARDRLVTAERMSTLGLLTAGLAHEINNPLTAVLSNVVLAADELAKLDRGEARSSELAEILDALNDAREAADRVRDIVRDLKVFSRHDEERNAPVDVRRVVESSLRMARNEIRHRARLATSFDAVPKVEATEARLGQVVLNLLINAAQAIPSGNAGANEIRVSVTHRSPSEVVIEVRDTGPGIPKEHLGRLFTPFFTTKSKGEGTGLGLSICRRIVEDLHGTLEAENAPDRGAVFRVVLPDADAAGGAPQSPVRVNSETPLPVRRGRVLVVDDDAAVARSIRRALEMLHDVTVVTSAADALASLSAGARFDVIVCDVMMPEVDGLRFFRKVAGFAPEQAERILFVTGGAFSEGARLFLSHIPNRTLEKPFRPADLRSLVNQMVF